VRGSHSGRPVMALLDLLGRRWTLRLIWELREEAMTFRALQERCDDVSPTVLNQRLADLRASLIVEHHAHGGYALTAEGKQLFAALLPLAEWAERWAQREQQTLRINRTPNK
jgi:DNA-binding HxlR family transcriptional regulator